MIKRIIIVSFLPLLAAERDMKFYVQNPMAEALRTAQAWAEESPSSDRGSCKGPTELTRNFASLFKWSPALVRDDAKRAHEACRYLDQFGIRVFSNAKEVKAFRGTVEGEKYKGIIFSDVCSHEDFMRSVSHNLTSISRLEIKPAGFPLVAGPITFIAGAQTFGTTPSEDSFHPLLIRGNNSGFLSVLNALAATAYFQGNIIQGQRLCEFTKGMVEGGQGILSHTALVEDPALISSISQRAQEGDKEAQKQLQLYHDDMATVYPTDMTTEQVGKLLDMLSRMRTVSMVQCETSYSRKKVLNTSLPVGLEVVRAEMVRKFRSTAKPVETAAYVVADTVKKGEEKPHTTFFAVAYGFYGNRLIGTIVDPYIGHNDYRIQAARNLLAAVGEDLQL